MLPRIGFPLEDGALLVLQTDNRDLYKFTDTNGDGVADKRETFFANYGRVTNIEWQPGGMTWALDNWMYTTYNPFRIRIARDGKVLREETDVNGGEWGTNQDNYGKLWFVDGAGGRPVNFQQPIVYGAFNVPDNFEAGFQEVWGAPGGIADMQGGMNAVRMPDQTLNRMTGAAGPEIYRGDRLPKDVVGDLLFTEPVGRIVRRAKVVVTDGVTQLRNAYPQSEFMRSTDPMFRPVNVANAPDGTIYVTDMYTGIIQEATFTGPGTYLRRKVEQYALDKVHNKGRIWRIRHDGVEPDRTMPRMYSETAAQLVAHLKHPNGWWRDTAQKLLVLRQDKSVVPALDAIVRTSTNQLERIHALWTLEGLDALTAPVVRLLMKDADPAIRIQAIRASETLYKAAPANRSFAADYVAMTKDPDPNVVIQAMLTLKLHEVAGYEAVVRGIRETSTVRGPKEVASQILRPQSAIGQPASNDAAAGYLNFTSEDRRTLLAGERVYRELCFSCHGDDGKGAPAGGAVGGPLLAAPLAGSVRVNGHRDYVIKVLLHGLTGPIDGVALNPGAVMAPMGTNTDEWIADVANFVRNAFGNSGRPLITPAQVAAVREANTRKTSWSVAELQPTILSADAQHIGAGVQCQSHNGAALSHAHAYAAGAAVGQRGRPGSGNVVPGSAAATRDRCGTPTRRHGADRARHAGTRRFRRPCRHAAGCRGHSWPWWSARRRRRTGSSGRAWWWRPRWARRRSGRGPRGTRVVSGADLDGRDHLEWTAVAQGAGSVPTTVIPLKPVQAKVRPDHPDRDGARRRGPGREQVRGCTRRRAADYDWPRRHTNGQTRRHVGRGDE